MRVSVLMSIGAAITGVGVRSPSIQVKTVIQLVGGLVPSYFETLTSPVFIINLCVLISSVLLKCCH